MAAEQQSAPENVQLHAFTNLDHAASIQPYVAALEAFDALPQLQELKVLARKRAQIGDGTAVLDVGCGFGLESLRLAHMVAPGGKVAGIDKSADFIKEAEARAGEAKLTIAFQVADAEALPFADGAFDVARAERVLVYLPEPKRALQEMRRVTRSGGKLLALTVKDDGHGLPQGIDVANGRSLGLRIMNGLAVQLGGELSWIEQERGTSVRLVFPRGLVDRVEPEQAGTVSTERLTLSSRVF